MPFEEGARINHLLFYLNSGFSASTLREDLAVG